MVASRSTYGYCLLLLFAVGLAYANSLHGPFVFDDPRSILDNPTIRHLGDLGAVLSPPNHTGMTVEARPVLNLSLAVNYALGGPAVAGYHLANLLIHAAAALLLFGILRRTVRQDLAAFAAALFWALHPLDTSAVTYVIQRAESLMALFYLLTLYSFLRRTDGGGVGWTFLSVLACALGMGTKEVMVSAPLVILLCDRTFVSGSCGEALRRRSAYYAALSLTWVIVIVLAWRSGGRGGTSGLGSGVTPCQYWLTQPGAILHYLRLVVWPKPLVFDYGTPWVAHPLAAVPALMVLLVLAAVTVRLLVHRSPAGFALAWFWMVLAPTSLVPGNRQVLAEHRVYLALAALACLAAWALANAGKNRTRGSGLLIVAALALGGVTFARNADYQSPLALFGHDVAANPDNAFAWENQSTALIAAHRYTEARDSAMRALSLNPRRVIAEDDLGSSLLFLGRPDEAEAHFRNALALESGFNSARTNLSADLISLGRPDEAAAVAKAAVALEPASGSVHGAYAFALAVAGRPTEAESEFVTALSLEPGNARPI